MSDTLLPNYTFLPWLRKGISNQITETENKGTTDPAENDVRASVTVKLKIKGEGTIIADPDADKTIQLIGPGDIVGFNTRAIVKTTPSEWDTNFEPNYLASIEFYDEDFPWRYTPAVANLNHQLRPWLFLFVLKEDEFTLDTTIEKTLSSITISDGAEAPFLPKFDELATWAHVQVNDNIDPDNTDILADALNALRDDITHHPDSAVSRIVSPRKLEENTNYYAFLVPTYETGRLAGLGVDEAELATIKAQAPSWGTAHVLEANRWPVYHSWSFKTGKAGDFEYLVRQLKPRAVDNRVGRREMDIQNAGFGLNYQVDLLDATSTKTTLSLEGALKVPGTEGEAYPYPDASDDVGYDPTLHTDFRKQLQDLLNLEEDFKNEGGLAGSDNYYGSHVLAGSSVDGDPIIAPPLYGRWHAMVNKAKVDDTEASGSPNWFNELNLDPRNRVVASIGTKTVQEKQDVLMDQAWAQLGDVIEANRKLNMAQLSVETSNALYKKHVSSQPNEKVLAMTGKMKRRIKNDLSSKTYFQEEKESKLPQAIEDKAMRRVMRPVGPVMKRIDPTQTINAGTDNLTDRLDKELIDGGVTAAIAKTAPDEAQTTSLSEMLDGVTPVPPIDPAVSSFAVGDIGEIATGPLGAEAPDFKTALAAFDAYFDSDNWLEPDPKASFDITKAVDVKSKIAPRMTLKNRVYKSVVFDTPIDTPDRIVPAMAHPVFKQPMYEAIRDLDTELLIPNLNLVPMNSIALLETNQKFIESFMTGLNHEMGRELLWREYPTDQRGTYFRQFWNVSDYVNTDALEADTLEESLYDIPKMDTWSTTSKLGDHNHRSDEANLVLLIRGDLLKKYPNAIIYAVEAEWQKTDDVDDYTLPRRPKTGGEKFPLFNAKIDPDITFIGFDLTQEDALGDDPDEVADPSPGYFFVLKERAGEVRFGMDIAPETVDPVYATWDDLHWGHLSSTDRIELGALTANPTDKDVNGEDEVTWSSDMNAAEMAMVLYQNPVMVSVHASEMLTALAE